MLRVEYPGKDIAAQSHISSSFLATPPASIRRELGGSGTPCTSLPAVALPINVTDLIAIVFWAEVPS
jgi:hypothetical protein